MDHPDKALEKSFLETIANSDLQDVGKTTAEVVIDSVLKEGLLRDIPLLSLVIGLAKAGVSVKEHMFIEKVLRFLSPLRKYTNEERRNYLASLDENELRNASQYMLLYLDRLDSLEKPPMLARVFEAFMLQQIRYKTIMGGPRQGGYSRRHSPVICVADSRIEPAFDRALAFCGSGFLQLYDRVTNELLTVLDLERLLLRLG